MVGYGGTHLLQRSWTQEIGGFCKSTGAQGGGFKMSLLLRCQVQFQNGVTPNTQGDMTYSR